MFYPADFTFVCPTEIVAMNAKYDEFQELGIEILAVSTENSTKVIFPYFRQFHYCRGSAFVLSRE